MSIKKQKNSIYALTCFGHQNLPNFFDINKSDTGWKKPKSHTSVQLTNKTEK